VLSDCITGVQAPATLDDFTDLVLRLHDRLGQRPPAPAPVPNLEQATAHLAVQAEVGVLHTHSLGSIQAIPAHVQDAAMSAFHDSSKKTVTTLMPPDSKRVALPGLMGRWTVEPGHILMVKYRIQMRQAQSVKLLFNTPQACRVWLDDAPLLARDAGAFVPAFHRTPLHQSAIVKLAPGEHTITAAMKADENHPQVTWVVALAEDTPHPVAARWLTDVFARVGACPLQKILSTSESMT